MKFVKLLWKILVNRPEKIYRPYQTDRKIITNSGESHSVNTKNIINKCFLVLLILKQKKMFLPVTVNLYYLVKLSQNIWLIFTVLLILYITTLSVITISNTFTFMVCYLKIKVDFFLFGIPVASVGESVT